MKDTQDTEWLLNLQTAQMNKYQALCVRVLNSDKTKYQKSLQVEAEKQRFDELSPKPADNLGCETLLKVIEGHIEFATKNKRTPGKGQGKAKATASVTVQAAPTAASASQDAAPAAPTAASVSQDVEAAPTAASAPQDVVYPQLGSGRRVGNRGRGRGRGGK